jgi:hypothetical protein
LARKILARKILAQNILARNILARFSDPVVKVKSRKTN